MFLLRMRNAGVTLSSSRCIAGIRRGDLATCNSDSWPPGFGEATGIIKSLEVSPIPSCRVAQCSSRGKIQECGRPWVSQSCPSGPWLECGFLGSILLVLRV